MKLLQYYEERTGEMREKLILTPEEQEVFYEQNIKEILNNPRLVLDTLEGRKEYKVRWNRYNLWKDGKHSG